MPVEIIRSSRKTAALTSEAFQWMHMACTRMRIITRENIRCAYLMRADKCKVYSTLPRNLFYPFAYLSYSKLWVATLFSFLKSVQIIRPSANNICDSSVNLWRKTVILRFRRHYHAQLVTLNYSKLHEHGCAFCRVVMNSRGDVDIPLQYHKRDKISIASLMLTLSPPPGHRCWF